MLILESPLKNNLVKNNEEGNLLMTKLPITKPHLVQLERLQL